MAKSDRADGYERFKNQISEEQISFEGKGKAARDIANVTHYIVTTNNGDALPLMEKDRRVCVLACEEEPKEPSYYKALGAWMEGPGPGLLAAFLRDFKFPADWDYRAPSLKLLPAAPCNRPAKATCACWSKISSSADAILSTATSVL